MFAHSSWSPSCMRYHSALASALSVACKRCANRAFTARASAVDSSDKRKHRLRTSPTAGPPRTRTTPRSTRRRRRRDHVHHPRRELDVSSSTTPLNAVPPVNATREGAARLAGEEEGG